MPTAQDSPDVQSQLLALIISPSSETLFIVMISYVTLGNFVHIISVSCILMKSHLPPVTCLCYYELPTYKLFASFCPLNFNGVTSFEQNYRL